MSVRNYKKFESAVFHFNPVFNVLIGDNATGKTAILDALSIGIGAYVLYLDDGSGRHIRPNEAREVICLKGELPAAERQFPVIIKCRGELHNEVIEWSRDLQSVKSKTSRVHALDIINIGRQDRENLASGNDVLLPLLCYYGTGRLWQRKNGIKTERLRIVDGYRDWYEPQANHYLFLTWIKQLDFGSKQQGTKYQLLKIVQSTVAGCIPGCQGIFYDGTRDELMVEFGDNKVFGFSNLSDGYRNMIAMVADIAHRAARLNPQLGLGAVRETPGIVLIDEIDLHLHPRWQRTVVEDLKRSFPKVQFVVTTHSPFILQSLEPGEAIDLNAIPGNPEDTITSIGAWPEPDADYADRSIEEISEEVMDVERPVRSAKNMEMKKVAEKEFKMLNEAKTLPAEKIAKALHERDHLIEPYKGEVAFYTFLKMKEAAVAPTIGKRVGITSGQRAAAKRGVVNRGGAGKKRGKE